MTQLIVQCGIGLLVGCVLVLAFFALMRRRAVRSTKRALAKAPPLTTTALQADKDRMRAEFAMSVRRLELGVDKLRERALVRVAPADKRAAEVSRLQDELDKKAEQIETLRARADLHKTVARRTVKLVLYIFARVRRRERPVVSAPPLFKFEQGPQWEFKKRPAPSSYASTATDLAVKAQPQESDLAATAAAIAAVNLKRRRAISKV